MDFVATSILAGKETPSHTAFPDFCAKYVNIDEPTLNRKNGNFSTNKLRRTLKELIRLKG
jgi:hypothetical protein